MAPHDQRPLVLIPAFKPCSRLNALVHDLLKESLIRAIVVVNDGSGPQSQRIFAKLARLDRTFVLTHEKNEGKGAALKTGFKFTAEHFPKSLGVVSADADGQHAPADIIKVAQALLKRPHDLILGSRNFDGDIPLRSKVGNLVTRGIFELLCGQKLGDTQTGLRGIPADLLPACAAIEQNAYDYELEMLIRAKSLKRKISELPIRTIYLDNNKSSHYQPLYDSLRVYAVFWRFLELNLRSRFK